MDETIKKAGLKVKEPRNLSPTNLEYTTCQQTMEENNLKLTIKKVTRYPPSDN
mgnify:CR=1 FL=1